ncbi:uncharacterized protein LOC104891918 [Beta vulgaris subsp. vulgaris]|uniref:uncharacterized protein LOC104891918 n=1 Tax=Beta vulgaris subsp. vulgaris TaxID=3555 RepID=UPI002036853B|nr:uncharacterized protein LOC104891918 [Beta vulgaris subsp. vulgaris]
MYGFCDSNYLSPMTQTNKEEQVDYLARIFGQNEGNNVNQLFFAPYHENRHWMLAVISPWNGVVFWFDPAGAENDIPEFAQRTINEGIIKFSLVYRKDIKKMKKNPTIKWKNLRYVILIFYYFDAFILMHLY